MIVYDVGAAVNAGATLGGGAGAGAGAGPGGPGGPGKRRKGVRVPEGCSYERNLYLLEGLLVDTEQVLNLKPS